MGLMSNIMSLYRVILYLIFHFSARFIYLFILVNCLKIMLVDEVSLLQIFFCRLLFVCVISGTVETDLRAGAHH